MFIRKTFYDRVRPMFGGSMSAEQVQGMGFILDAWEHSKLTKLPYLAYILATAKHETAHTMQPIHERGGRGYLSKYDTGRLAKALGNTPQADGDGILYCGRGFVQLTGRRNYERASNELGVDFLNHPDLAMHPDYAAQITIKGMTEGWFTGKKLSNYLDGETLDFVHARRIINGMDKADLIAGYARDFYGAVIAAYVADA